MKYLIIFLFGLALSFCATQQTQLQHIKQQGKITVAVLPYTHLSLAQKKLDMLLIQRFAQQLQVKSEIVTVDNSAEIINLLKQQKVQFAIVHNPLHQHPYLRTTPFYQQLAYYLVSHRKNPVKQLKQISQPIYTTQHTTYTQIIEQFTQQHPDLNWQRFETSSKNLLSELDTQHVVLTDSQQLAEIHHFYPQLSIMDTVSQQQIGWAFLRQTKEDSLYQAAVEFIEQTKYTGELETLYQYHHGEITPADDFNEYNMNSFYQYMVKRLPLYRHHFELGGLHQNMDWRLIASVGYEESLWNPDAVSRTGVRGLMMLTEDTADYLGVKDREDPVQSIEGGSRYLRKLYARLPDEISEPDRTWFMLASYNAGFGHVMDARILAKEEGFNPNRWGVVKKYLLLLSKPEWYKKTKYGKARGYEAVEYVRRIRRYYVMLKFIDQKSIPSQTIHLPSGYKTFPYQYQAVVW